MPRRIIIHAGFHKTGTSTIQGTLRENRVALKKHIALRMRWHMKDLVAATRGYSTWRDPLTMIKVQHRFGLLMNELPGMPRRTLIISAEELSGHLPGRDDIVDYSAAPVLLYAFWEIAKERFPAAEIMIYLSTRAPEPWLKSAYWEHVKASNMTMDFDAFAQEYEAASDLEAMVADIASRVPVPVYHKRLEDCAGLSLGPTAPLLSLCDIPDDLLGSLVSVAPENQRLGDDVIQALLKVNRSYDTSEQRKAAKKIILTEASQA
jgi:hypothetical protein